MAVLFFSAGLACSHSDHGEALVDASVPKAEHSPKAESSAALAGILPKERSPFEKLPLVTFHNVNTKEQRTLRLYSSYGTVDEQAATELDGLLADHRRQDCVRTRPIERRLLQLVFRAAYHFKKTQIEIVSGYREPQFQKRREGLHAKGKAIDFRILGIEAPKLASYLRTLPKVGVGIYTHPKTRFVHLDVRDMSFHWLDASPPRRKWRERNISGKGLAALDRAYRRAGDWPEGLEFDVD